MMPSQGLFYKLPLPEHSSIYDDTYPSSSADPDVKTF
jgi:hypothetical protein